MKKVLYILLAMLLFLCNQMYSQQPDLTESKLIGHENFQSQPEYPGGMEAFNTYITSAVKNSELYKGKWMIISFIIKSDGTMEKVAIVKSIKRSVDRQVIEAMKNCKTWKPAYKDNTPVEVQVSLPIRF
jgi:protein TonB